MNKLFQKRGSLLIVGFVAIFTCLLLTSAVNAATPSVLLYTHVNKKTIKINQMATVLALSTEANSNLPPDSIKMFKDNGKNPVAVCINEYSCSYTFWESDVKNANKWVKFKVVSTYGKSTATKMVWVFVNKVIDKQTPQVNVPKVLTDEKPANPFAYDKIITSNHQPKVGEYFSAEIYPSYPALLSDMHVHIDGKSAQWCVVDSAHPTCAHKFGPFLAGDIGEHKYEFVMQDKNGKTNSVWGKFWVIAAPDAGTDAPEYEKMTVSGYTITAGEKFKATVFAKPGQTLFAAKGYVGGYDLPQMSCYNVSTCEMAVNTMADYMIGEHTFKFVLEAKNGKTTTLEGAFVVVKKDEKDLVAPNVTIVSDKETLKLGESATVTATASDNKAVSKIEILLFSGVVKECLGVNTCTYQIGPVTEKTYVNSFAYGAVAYDAAGNNMYTGNKYISVDMMQPKVVQPTVSIEASKTKISTTDTVNFKSTVNSGSKKLVKVQLLINGVLSKECTTDVCEYTGGPYSTFVGTAISYSATAQFSDGSVKTTGYYYISVMNAPTISVVSAPNNPADTSAVMFTANATGGNKTISYIDIAVNGKSVKTCLQSTTCSFVGGPYPEYAGKSIAYSATVYFTDGSSISDAQTLPIVATTTQVIEPKITLKSDKTSALAKETYALTSTLDQGGKKVDLWRIYKGNKTLVTYCNTGLTTCTYYGYILDSTVFYALADFSDGTSYESDRITINLIPSGSSRTQ